MAEGDAGCESSIADVPRVIHEDLKAKISFYGAVIVLLSAFFFSVSFSQAQHRVTHSFQNQCTASKILTSTRQLPPSLAAG